MTGEIDYTKLSRRELQDLINKMDSKADEEHDRRVRTGEIKLRTVTLDDIKQMYRKPKKNPRQCGGY